jgi:hypoxanthine phosphoribosyltransferase
MTVAEIPIAMRQGKVILDWNSIQALVRVIRMQFEETFYVPERVLALGSGAVIPTRLLSGGARLFYEGVCSYKAEEQGRIETFQQCREALNDPGTLVVDDLWDTGETFRYAKKLWPEATYAALVSKVDADETFLDYIGLVLPTKSWIIFPWETD